MTDRQKLLLAVIAPAIVLVASTAVFIQQLLILSEKAREHDAAQAEEENLEYEKASLLTRIAELENERDQWKDVASGYNEQLLGCQSELAQAQSLQTSPNSCAFALGEIDPVSDCITVTSRSSEQLDLAGWTISDGEGSYTFPLLTWVEPFGSFRVCVGTYNPDRDPQQLLLFSSSDEVYLRDPDGRLCDQASW